MSVVRSSKFRHIFGKASKPDAQYQDLRVTKNAWDSNILSVNPYYIAVNWEAGGGAFALINQGSTGKVGSNLPLFSGHKGAVLETKFNPFNDQIIASGSEDCTAMIWGIPEGGATENVTAPLITLKGHGRKCGHLAFHPHAANVLATNSPDLTIRTWDIEKGVQQNLLSGHKDMLLDFDWSHDGKNIVSVAKDKTIKLWDPRQAGDAALTGSGTSHAGVKGSRVCWLGNKDKIFTFGFSKMSERQYSIWDPKDLSKPLVHTNIDTSSGILMPFFDNDTNVLFLAGKGDGNVRFYEIVDDAPYIHYLSEYKSSTPQAGMAMLPKRAVDVSSCEIVKMFKLTGKGAIDPISFTVPRKAEVFQEDLFPDTKGGVAAHGAEAWFGGADAEAAKINLEGGFVKVESTFNAAEQAAAAEAKVGPKTQKEVEKELVEANKSIADLTNQVQQRDVIIRRLELELKEAKEGASA